MNTKISKVFKQEIHSVVEQIKKKYRPQKIILFGSAMSNRVNKNSDIDLLIIKETKKRMVDRIGEVLNLCDCDIPVEPIVYTPNELRKRLEMGDFFIRDILKKGKVLYG